MEENKEPIQAGSPEAPADGCRRSMGRLRFQTGLAVLFTAMGAMVVLVLLDIVISARSQAERTLLSNAFEAFKLIAVTVLGYIFGANQTAKPGGGDNG